MKVVLVTGGRDYADDACVYRVLAEEQPTLVMHGAAKTWSRRRSMHVGADHFAGLWADDHCVAQLRYPANWEAFGKRAGPMRNSWLVLLLKGFQEQGHECCVVAFPGGSGTADTVAKARKAGFSVREISA